jgi:hypothetical protein
MKNFTIKNEKINGVDMVRITVTGDLLLTIEEAYEFSEAVLNVAELPAFEEHIDEVFDNWGKPGFESC